MHVVADARLAQSIDDFTDRQRITAAPDHDDTLALLLVVKRAATHRFGYKFDAADPASLVTGRVSGVAQRTILWFDSSRFFLAVTLSSPAEGLHIEDCFATRTNRKRR